MTKFGGVVILWQSSGLMSMKKFIGVASVAVLALVCARAIQGHQARPAVPALPDVERQALRDALNSDYSDLNGDVKHILSDMKTQASGPAALSGAAVPAAQDAAAAKTKEAGAAIARTATTPMAERLRGALGGAAAPRAPRARPRARPGRCRR